MIEKELSEAVNKFEKLEKRLERLKLLADQLYCDIRNQNEKYNQLRSFSSKLLFPSIKKFYYKKYIESHFLFFDKMSLYRKMLIEETIPNLEKEIKAKKEYLKITFEEVARY